MSSQNHSVGPDDMVCGANSDGTPLCEANAFRIELRRLREEKARLRKEMAARSLNALQDLAATEQRRDEYKRERDEARREAERWRNSVRRSVDNAPIVGGWALPWEKHQP